MRSSDRPHGPHRPRRLRADGVRRLVAETSLSAADLIAPVFVDATTDDRQPIPSMPGHERVPVDEAVERVREVLATGVESVILFGIPESKDDAGSRAYARDGVIQRATRAIAAETDAYVIGDVCLCEYTDHGHCGALTDAAGRRWDDGESDGRHEDGDDPIVENDLVGDNDLTVDNDRTLELLARTAVSQADAGVDMIAPSSMTDGMVAAIRTALDEAGHESVPIMSYAVKYESAFYGPFRDAADGAPAFGNRRHYQMDPANRREALREARLDAEEGADLLMVKPALPYLDIVADLRREFDHPIVAYNVSGEYAMVHAAAENGWLDLDAVAMESLTAIKRAGADLVVTYFAEDIAEQL